MRRDARPAALRLPGTAGGVQAKVMRLNKYVWLCLAFVLIYLLAAQERGPLGPAPALVWSVFVFALVSSGLRTYLAFRPRGREARWNRLFNSIDTVVLSIAIALTRGIESDLWLIYFALMTFSALNASSSSILAVDVSVVVLYTAATLPRELNPHTAVPPVLYVQMLATRLFFLIIVSALAGRLNSDAEERSREVLRLREQMASAEERSRIAREVHDGLGHMMVSTLLRLELCSRLLERSPAEAADILREEIPALRGAWNEARDLAFHLRPWELLVASQGLAPTLRERCRTFAERTGLVVEVTADEELVVPPEPAFALMRIVQEALTNAAKHAGATRVEVRLSAPADSEIVCEISDDGCGFDPTTITRGTGLTAMCERAEALGGTLTIVPGPECGALVRVELRL